MLDPTGFAKYVPGFDFLEGLVKNAGAAMPGIGQWVAPTINPQELEKRIQELRAVQFWLEQNARMLGATIQALEVQRMTLSTLKTMNVQMTDLRDSLIIQPTTPEAAPNVATRTKTQYFPPPASKTPDPAAGDRDPAAAADKPAGPAGVDPMQWWGALTQQFTDLARAALAPKASEPETVPAAPPAATAPPAEPPAAPPPPVGPPAAAVASEPAAAANAALPMGADPLQWWGALTQQFTELATAAIKESAANAAKGFAAVAPAPTPPAPASAKAPRKAAPRKAASRKAVPRKAAPRKRADSAG